MRNARNVAILALVALGIVVLPGGGTAAAIVYSVLSAIFAAALAYFLARLYREHRAEIYSLGELERTMLYGALVVIVLTVAASSRLFSTGGGEALFFALLALSGGALALVYRSWREY